MRYLLFLTLLVACPAWGKGTLVIVGGGLSPDNAEIYRAFIDAAKGGTIAIIPSASGEPSVSLHSFAANLERYGVSRDRIVFIQLAAVDDPETPTVDEASWAANASNADEVAKVKMASAIWFTGGDQARTTRMLMQAGKDSSMLKTIRKRLKAGAVVGGTSAGAAIMGTGMIVCGDPKRAGEPIGTIADCAPKEGQSEPLVLGRGLGFLRGYVVDQHFSQRARLPRLQRAVACGAGRGLGIDEDTAMVVDLGSKQGRIIGNGNVAAVAALRSGGRCTSARDATEVMVWTSGQKVTLQR
jgi:cyanophycinase